MLRSSLSETFTVLSGIMYDIIKEAGEDPSDYIVKSQPFGALERLDGQPIPDELEFILLNKLQLN